MESKHQSPSPSADHPAEYAAYLLEHECGLPQNAELQASVIGLRRAVHEIVDEGALSPDELAFLITRAIDIMPENDLAAAAIQAGLSQEAAGKIAKEHSRLLTRMREARESL